MIGILMPHLVRLMFYYFRKKAQSLDFHVEIVEKIWVLVQFKKSF